MRLLIYPSLLCLAFFLTPSCAKEVSDEQKRREENNREYERLQVAAGTFDGYVAVSDAAGVPADLSIAAKRNPSSGNDQPILEISLRLGLFGGVLITASDAAYDWGSGQLTAVFRKSAGGSVPAQGLAEVPGGQSDALELRATVTKDTVTDAVLIGPRIGALPVTLKPRQTTPAEQPQEYQLALSFKPTEDSEVPSVLSLKRFAGDVKGPSFSDLPLLPPLEASLRFQSLANAPQRAQQTLYDPLLGTIDLILSDTGSLKLNRVFVPIDKEAQALRLTNDLTIKGSMNVGARNAASITALWSPAATSLTESLGGVPPRLHVGTYKGADGGLEFKSIVVLDYVGINDKNSADIGFDTFPSMRLKVMTCMGDILFKSRNFTFVSLDYLNRKAYLRESQTSVLEIFFAPGWRQLDGYFYNQSMPTNPGSSAAQMHVTALTNGVEPSCQSLTGS